MSFTVFRFDPSQVDLSRVDRALTRFALRFSVVVGVLYLGLGALTSNAAFFGRLPGVVVVAATAGWMIAKRRERLSVILTLAAAVIVIQVALLGPPGLSSATPTLTIVVVGTIGSVVVYRRVIAYLLGYSLLLVGAQLLWNPEDPSSALVQGILSAVTFCFVSMTFTWLKAELGRSNVRYQQLFDAAPVTIRVEDFSEVGRWLERLRSAGVTDLAAWLEEDRERIRHGARLIEVVDVNKTGIQILEASELKHILGPIPESGMTDGALDSFAQQFLAIWNGEHRVVVEVDGGRTLRNKHIDLLLYWDAPRIDGRVDLSRVTVAMVDVTELRQSERSLTDLLRSKDDFVASVSHELRTPLTTVVGLSEELRDHRHEMSDTEVGDLLNLLASESGEVSAIVEDLLTAARVDAGGVTVSTQDVDLVHEVNSVLRTLGDRPVLTSASGPAIARGDAARIRQVLRNLIVNAQKYGGPVISVKVHTGPDTVAVSVCDNGAALPEHQRGAIFERYFRAGQQPGLTASVGLGLAVSRELARLMEGDLTYHHDGSHSVFTLRLPVAATGTAAAQRAAG